MGKQLAPIWDRDLYWPADLCRICGAGRHVWMDDHTRLWLICRTCDVG